MPTLLAIITAPNVSVAHALIQMVVALTVIIGSIYVLSKVLSRVRGGMPRTKQKGAGGLQIISRQPLGKELSIATVLWNEREILVGIAGSNITFLNDARGEDPGSEIAPRRSGPAGLGEQQLPVAQHFADFSSTLLDALKPAGSPATISPIAHKPKLLDSLRDATLRH
jgi:flagellar biogenesis protein FliO